MGLISHLSEDSRWGVLSLLPLFVLGAYFLNKVRQP
jgi:MFS-type transporter involved in bile tolerance (Atg22 family)